MDILVLTLAAIAATSPLTINVAPDQPAPFIYTDDPLIVELISDQDIEVAVDLDIQSPGGRGHRQRLGPFTLEAGHPFWFTTDAVPRAYGPHTLALSATWDGRTLTEDRTIFRVDRARIEQPLPVGVIVGNPSDTLLYALRALPASFVALSGPFNDIESTIQRVQATLNCPVEVLIDAESPDSRAIAQGVAANVSKWVITASTLEAAHTVAEQIIGSAPEAHIAVRVPDITALADAIAQGRAHWLQEVVVSDPAHIAVVRSAASRAGNERISTSLVLSAPDNGAARTAFAIASAHAQTTQSFYVEADDIFSGDILTPTYAIVGGAIRMLGQAAHIGPAKTKNGQAATIFRQVPPTESADWLIAIAPTEDLEHALEIPVGNAQNLSAFDVYGNPLAPPITNDGILSVKPSSKPTYIRGQGGDLLHRLVRQRLNEDAKNLASNDKLAPKLPPGLPAVLQNLAELQDTSSRRYEFITLLRALADYEHRRHVGTLEPAIAVDLIARTAALARSIGFLEQEHGHTLLEPLEKTLSTCNDIQKRFSTPENALSPRAQWLLEETARLAQEARDWDAAGRETEAKAVAAIAEWRGRCLEIAAQPPRENPRPAVITDPNVETTDPEAQ